MYLSQFDVHYNSLRFGAFFVALISSNSALPHPSDACIRPVVNSHPM